MPPSARKSSAPAQVGIYECEITLKFRFLEENQVIDNRDRLLEVLVDAFSYGNDEFVEALDSHVNVVQVPEVDASPLMRRQLIRLRNLAID
ncbi:MAG: Npun_R1517 family heterocyst differentiation transcriptional regulator [Nodosilinea sp. LVE1205-7]|jgi:hypothetical protein